MLENDRLWCTVPAPLLLAGVRSSCLTCRRRELERRASDVASGTCRDGEPDGEEEEDTVDQGE